MLLRSATPFDSSRGPGRRYIYRYIVPACARAVKREREARLFAGTRRSRERELALAAKGTGGLAMPAYRICVDATGVILGEFSKAAFWEECTGRGE